MGRSESDGADVIAVNDPYQDRPQQHLDLESAEPALIQETRNLNFRLAGHLVPSRIIAMLVDSLVGESGTRAEG